MSLKPDQIAELERLEKAATPGDWAVHPDIRESLSRFVNEPECVGYNIESPAGDVVGIEGLLADKEADAVYIVATRNALPALLQMAREHAAKDAEIARLREALDRFRYACAFASADAWDMGSDTCNRLRHATSMANMQFDPLTDNQIAALAKQFFAETGKVAADALKGET